MDLSPFGDTTAAVARQWLQGLGRRQEAISNNIANLDTPGYHAQDVPFEAELRRSLANGSTRLAVTNARHLTPGGTQASGLGLQQAQQLTSQRLDSNDVDIDAEMVKLSETQMRYQAAASALGQRISIIREAIRG
ncbi:MAG: flagellar basal body rod protein FlgB [Dehalococcoidia bacterium]